MARTLFLQAPSFEEFDSGAGSCYQAKREIRSFWYPTWSAQPVAVTDDKSAPMEDMAVGRSAEPIPSHARFIPGIVDLSVANYCNADCGFCGFARSSGT